MTQLALDLSQIKRTWLDAAAPVVLDTDRLRWAVHHFDAYDWAHVPEDFGQARQYIDAQMLKQNRPN